MVGRDKYLAVGDNKGDVSLRVAVGVLVRRIGDVLPALSTPIQMYLAGGMAVNFYTGSRTTLDVDASFSRRILLPKAEDLVVSFEVEPGKVQSVYLDTNYNSSFALMHPDYEQDAYKVLGDEFANPKIELRILSPVDLAVSKVSRFENNDKEDIRMLAQQGLITAGQLKMRAMDALGYYVGNTSMLLMNLKEAVGIAQSAELLFRQNHKGNGCER